MKGYMAVATLAALVVSMFLLTHVGRIEAAGARRLDLTTRLVQPGTYVLVVKKPIDLRPFADAIDLRPMRSPYPPIRHADARKDRPGTGCDGSIRIEITNTGAVRYVCDGCGQRWAQIEGLRPGGE